MLPISRVGYDRGIGNKPLCRSRLSDFGVADSQAPQRARPAGPYTLDIAFGSRDIFEGSGLAAALAADAAPALLDDNPAEQIDGRPKAIFTRYVERRIDRSPQSCTEKFIGHVSVLEHPN